MTDDELIELLGPTYRAVSTLGAKVLSEIDLPAGGRVLDVGTGAGKSAIFMARQGFAVVTGEPDDDTTHYARLPWAENAAKAGVADRISFEHFSAGAMPFDTDSFDAVIYFGVLHHIEASERNAALAESLRVCRPAGAVVFFEPTMAQVERIWETDPVHPLPANPGDYVAAGAAVEERIDGGMMDIYLYRPVG